jgi:hypothetical protein
MIVSIYCGSNTYVDMATIEYLESFKDGHLNDSVPHVARPFKSACHLSHPSILLITRIAAQRNGTDVDSKQLLLATCASCEGQTKIKCQR